MKSYSNPFSRVPISTEPAGAGMPGTKRSEISRDASETSLLTLSAACCKVTIENPRIKWMLLGLPHFRKPPYPFGSQIKITIIILLIVVITIIITHVYIYIYIHTHTVLCFFELLKRCARKETRHVNK